MIDWDHWRQMPTVELRDAIALSLDIDPDNPRPKSEGDLGSESELQNDPEAIRSNVPIFPGGFTYVYNPMESEDFLKRMRLAKAHVANGMLQGKYDDEAKANRVSLSAFVHWAQSMGLSMPDELISLAAVSPELALDKMSPAEIGKKGGSREKFNQDLQTAINRIAAEIKQAGSKPTVSTVKTWIRRKTYDPQTQKPRRDPTTQELVRYNFKPIIPNCDELIIDGAKLVWKDRDGREQSIAVSSLRRYINRSKD